MSHVLIVDDDPAVRKNLEDMLQRNNLQTCSAITALEGIDFAQRRHFDLIILDCTMPGMRGIEALSMLKKITPKSKVIMITAFATIEKAVEAIKKGASEYIPKPFDFSNLLMLVRQVLEELRFEYEIKKLGMGEILRSLSNPIRRKIIRLIWEHKEMRMMVITRELGIEDHTNVIFHLKTLKESGLIEQSNHRAYRLTEEGKKIKECLGILDHFLSE